MSSNIIIFLVNDIANDHNEIINNILNDTEWLCHKPDGLLVSNLVAET